MRIAVPALFRRLRGGFSGDRLSARDRRALRLGLVLAVPIAAWMFVIRPYRAALADLKARVEAERALLAREEALLVSADVLPARADDAAAHAERIERRLVSGANMALIEGAVTDHLESLAQKSRVLLQEIRSMQPDRRDAEFEVVKPVRLAVKAESDLDGITRLLLGIEESPLLFRIEELLIEPQMTRPQSTGRGRNSQPAGPARPTGVVQVSMIVVAYARPPAPDADVGAETLE